MAKKESRISINKLEGMLNTLTASVPLPGDPNVEVKIKHNLSLNEMLQFVENVVSSCVDAESGKFYPEIMWFSIYSSVLMYGGRIFEKCGINRDEAGIYEKTRYLSGNCWV